MTRPPPPPTPAPGPGRRIYGPPRRIDALFDALITFLFVAVLMLYAAILSAAAFGAWRR